jgi:SAM-dependent methyltransferase
MSSDDGATAVASGSARGDDPVRALIEAAARRYAAAGRFAIGFARGKLRYDPVFVSLLRAGLVPDGVRVLDLGCGQGVLLALLVAARDQYRAGRWPAGWPAPPLRLGLKGIDSGATAVRRARLALGAEAEVEAADLRTAGTLASSDVVALLDVIHYLDEAAQERLLTAVADALPPGGVFLMRVGDPTAGVAAALTRLVDQLATLVRAGRLHRFHCRTIPDWTAALERRGFAVRPQPKSEGTPFANVLLVARKSRR